MVDCRGVSIQVLVVGILVVWLATLIIRRYLQTHSFVTNRRILVLFSGGQDSAAALFKVLTETDYVVHAHHIILVDSQNRWYPELMACRHIVQWLHTHVRPFLYTENVYTNTTFVPNNMEIQRFVAGELSKIALSERDPYKYIVSGRNATDNTGREFERRSKRAHTIYNAMLMDIPFYQRAVFWFPLSDMTKDNVNAYLRDNAKGILDLTWSCRTPVFDIPDDLNSYRVCKRCKTCMELMDDHDRQQAITHQRRERYKVNQNFIDTFVTTPTLPNQHIYS